jgi:hypothetical protein
MAYPTTLALITALWSGPGRTKAIALWSAIGGGIAALGPLVAGGLLEKFWWGSVFLVTLPLAGVALLMAVFFVPSHVNETSDPVDNLGGVLSVVLVGTLILAINFAPVPNKGILALGLASGTADLQRDLGGAIMQSIFGALLTAGYAGAVATTIAASPQSQQINNSVQNQLTKSFSSAADTAQQYPQYAQQIIAGAKAAFLSGADWAYAAGIFAIALGAALVFFLFPKYEDEQRLLADYHAEDVTRSTART